MKYSSSQSTLIFPKPDQIITLSNLEKRHYAKLNESALKFWSEKHRNIEIKDKIKPYSLVEIEESYLKFNSRLKEKNTFLNFARNGCNFFINIKITDLDKTIKVGLVESSFNVVNEVESISISSETARFLFTQLFARGTLSINGRVSFNYESAHMFFLFFFIPYANNIGVFFNSAHQLTKHMLMSILKTFVMTAIVNVTKKKKSLLKKKVERDIENFIGVFLTTTDNDPDFEIFNAEPQNEQL